MEISTDFRDTRFDYWWCLLAWLTVWGLILHMGKGAREVESQYRLNFWHAVVSSVLALWCLYDPYTIPESVTTPCSQAYFITDLFNMVMNDYVYKVGGYHKKTARRVEYAHHILCITCCFVTELYHEQICDFPSESWGVAPSGKPSNPTVRIMMAELSTPFLMRWRMTGEKNNWMFYVFVLTFLASRVGYQCFLLMPYVFCSMFFLPSCLLCLSLSLFIYYCPPAFSDTTWHESNHHLIPQSIDHHRHNLLFLLFQFYRYFVSHCVPTVGYVSCYTIVLPSFSCL